MKTQRILLVASLVLIAGSVQAQLPDAGTTAFSMGGNYTAAARGFEAVAWNPANLGFTQNPGFSLNLFTGGGVTGLDPVRFNDIADYGGKLIPADVKEKWLQAIGSGNERGTVDGGFSVVALSIGHFGFQAGLAGAGAMNLNQDAAEALLFGNAGRTGTPKSFSFNGSNANGGVFGVGAVSVGIPVMQGDHGEQFAIGITGKYIGGVAGGRAQDNGSTVTPNNVNVQFPTVYTDSAHIGDAGSGVGLDVGLSWTNGTTSFGATARNVVNTFSWSPSAFRSRVGTFTFDGTTSKSSFEEAPYATAPQALRTALEEEKFKPEISAGVAHQVGSLLIAADARSRFGDGIAIGPKMHVGVGAEYTGLPVLALRGGAAVVTDGFQLAGGIGLRLGSYELGIGGSTMSKNGGQALGVLLSLVSIR